MLDDPWYDHENYILIGSKNKMRYAFRPHEIRVAVLADRSNVADVSRKAVDLVNKTWEEANNIKPTWRKRKLPPVYSIYRLLPQANCKKCGFPTCIAFAAALRNNEATLEQCPLLSEPEYSSNREQILDLFSME